MDSIVVATMVANNIPGAAVVLVAGGRVRILRAYGVADIESQRPVHVDSTIFRIGSVSKVLTALGLIRLIDEGRLGLDEAVETHLSRELVASGAFERNITARHLLSHSAGFDQIGLRRQVEDPAERPDLQSFLARELEQVREPGVVGVYDTYGMTLAGQLIQEVSGTTYDAYMRNSVFAPLGMSSSFVETPTASRPRLATGYGIGNDTIEAQSYEWYVTLPASSIDATVADMGRLLVALLGGGANEHGRLLSPGMASRVLTESQLRYAPDMTAFSWGFWEENRGGYRALHHGGIMRGYSSELYLVPEAGVGLFVAYNRDPETGPNPMLREKLVDLLYEILPRRAAGPGAPDNAVPVPSAGFAGAYGSTVGCFTCAEGEGWGVNTIRFTSPAVGIIAMGDRRWLAVDSSGFRGEVSGALLRFLVDSSGAVRYMVQGPNSFARLDERLLDEILGPRWKDEQPAPLVAIVHRANERWGPAAAAYRSLAVRFPSNGTYPFYHGFSLLHTGDFAAARSAFETALERRKWMPWSRYYIASAHAGAGDSTAAFAALREAIATGFNDRNLPMSEPWWERLRASPEFIRIVESMGR